MELDVSTKEEALTKAQVLMFLDSDRFTEGPASYWDQALEENMPATFVSLGCRIPHDHSCGGLLFVDDILKRIYLHPNYSLSFSKVVEHLGFPDFVQIFRVPSDTSICDITLLWKKDGIRATFFNWDSEIDPVECTTDAVAQAIESNRSVHQVIYMLASDIDILDVPNEGRDFPWLGFLEE